jgi:N-acetylmuramoyl-L-alanine amidase
MPRLPTWSLVALLALACRLDAAPAAPKPTTPATPPAARTAATKPPAAKTADKPDPTKPAPPKPGAARQRGAWKVIDFRGMAYVDLADVAAFFDFQVYRIDRPRFRLEKERVVDGRKLVTEWRGQAGSKMVSLNKLNFYLSYPVVAWKDGRMLLSAFDLIHVIDPILRPDQQRESSQLKVVVLDPARGGEEAGITSRYGKEKDVTLAVALEARTLLEKQGFRVVMTRDSDQAVSIPERLRIANAELEEAVFISLHCSLGNEREKGIEMFTLAPSATPSTTGDEGRKADEKFYPGNINDRESMALATALLGMAVSRAEDTNLGATDLGLRRARFAELKGIRMPGVVYRLGRLAHAEEGRRLAHEPAYRHRIAKAIAAGVDRYARVMAAGSPPKQRALKFARVTSSCEPGQEVAPGEIVRVRATISKTDPAMVIDPGQVSLQIYFLDFVNEEEIDLSSCDTPKAQWISVIPDWADADYEEVEFIYRQPIFDAALVKQLGVRRYYGFVLRLVYKDELMDERAEPPNVRRGLGNFTAVLPRRK